MFNLGMPELILIFVVALIVFGPKQLPEIARIIAKAMNEFKKHAQGVKDAFYEYEDTDYSKQAEEEDVKEVEYKGKDLIG